MTGRQRERLISRRHNQLDLLANLSLSDTERTMTLDFWFYKMGDNIRER